MFTYYVSFHFVYRIVCPVSLFFFPHLCFSKKLFHAGEQHNVEMGLDDIDEETIPPQMNKCATNPPKRVDLGELFEDLGLGPRQVIPTTIRPAPKNRDGDFLDSVFSDSTAPTAAQQQPVRPTPSEDLLDFSNPPARKVHEREVTDPTSLLDEFVSQSKGIPSARKQPTLADVSYSAPSTARVAAQFLSIMDYYDVLGVSRNATVEEIKRQFRKKAMELHPDKVGRAQSPQEAELFKVITKAHEVLVDPERRQSYDAELKQRDSMPAFAQNWLSHLEH
jgi:hypothetical protein